MANGTTGKTQSNASSEGLKKFRNSWLGRLMYDKGVFYFILSFIIPSAIMCYGFAKAEIYPHGNNQFLVVDLWHQYYPFFRVVREKLLTGGSFMYSWQNGMGTNFLSLISYYAASPLNWLSVFVDDKYTREALMYILVAKIGFCSAFFSCFLRYTYNRKDLSIVVFSSMFALCSYMLGYYWNVMWFDTIALFPLVMTGVVAMCREGKWKLYTISLALSLISNYYIGYFTCLFTVLMFGAAIIIEGKGIKDFFVKLFLIIRSSLIAAGLGGFILLPAYLALQLTYSATNYFPKDISWYEKWTDIFANMLSYSEPAMKEGLPNFACGMLAVVMIGVFLLSTGIKIREKIFMTLMLAFIAVSCNMNKLNFIWHGFHVTNQIPYRFAFIFCFILVAAAYRGYEVISRKGIKIYHIIALLLGPAAVFYLNYRKLGDEFKIEGAIKSSMIITAAYILIIVAAKIFPFKDMKARRSVMNVCLAAAVVCELSSNAVIGVKTVGSSDRPSYPTRYDEVRELLDDAKSKESDLFYRSEMTGTYTLNDSSTYGYYGVSQFSSSAIVAVTRYFQRLGLYGSEAGNRYYYRTAPPFVNELLGIKYLISKNTMLATDEDYLEYQGASGVSYMYKNKYPLSLGFMMNEEILDMPDEASLNPFEYQNKLTKLATGTEQNLYVAQPIALVDYADMEVTKNSYGDYSYTKLNTDVQAKGYYDFNCSDDGTLYGYCTNGGLDFLTVTCDDESVETRVDVKDYPIVFPMGNGKSGSVSHITFMTDTDNAVGHYKLMVYEMRNEAFNEIYSELADEQLEITEFSDTRIKGGLNVKKDGVLYLSIPYEKGWTVKVDGNVVETFPVMNAMLGAKVSAGQHEITLEYTPDGFTIGLAVSCAMLVMFIILAVLDVLKKKKSVQTPETPAAEEKPAEMEDVMNDISVAEVLAEDEKSEGDDSVSGD